MAVVDAVCNQSANAVANFFACLLHANLNEFQSPAAIVSICMSLSLYLSLSVACSVHMLSLSAGSCTVRMSNEKVIKFKGCNWEHS